eukprot:6487332-Amphidinium_carterae.1
MLLYCVVSLRSPFALHLKSAASLSFFSPLQRLRQVREPAQPFRFFDKTSFIGLLVALHGVAAAVEALALLKTNPLFFSQLSVPASLHAAFPK